MGDFAVRRRDFLLLLFFMCLASTYMTQENYYVRKQMTDLFLASALGVFISGLTY